MFDVTDDDPQRRREVIDDAIKKVVSNTDPDWAEKAYCVVIIVCGKMLYYVAEDVWSEFEAIYGVEFAQYKVHNRSAICGPMMRAAKDGFCVCIGVPDNTTEARRAIKHSRPQRVWKSLIYREFHPNDQRCHSRVGLW